MVPFSENTWRPREREAEGSNIAATLGPAARSWLVVTQGTCRWVWCDGSARQPDQGRRQIQKRSKEVGWGLLTARRVCVCREGQGRCPPGPRASPYAHWQLELGLQVREPTWPPGRCRLEKSSSHGSEGLSLLNRAPPSSLSLRLTTWVIFISVTFLLYHNGEIGGDRKNEKLGHIHPSVTFAARPSVEFTVDSRIPLNVRVWGALLGTCEHPNQAHTARRLLSAPSISFCPRACLSYRDIAGSRLQVWTARVKSGSFHFHCSLHPLPKAAGNSKARTRVREVWGRHPRVRPRGAASPGAGPLTALPHWPEHVLS